VQDDTWTRVLESREDGIRERENGFYAIVASPNDQQSQARSRDVLLVLEIAIHRAQHVKPCGQCAAEQLSVFHTTPTCLNYSLDLVARQCTCQVPRP
jgi:hypothetical protein